MPSYYLGITANNGEVFFMEENRTQKSRLNVKNSIQTIAVMAVLMAVQAVLGILEIHTATIKISLSFIPVVIAARLYGGMGGALVAGFGDIIGCIIHPVGAWFPPITITYALSGFIYGLFLKKGTELWRVLVSVSITQLIMSLFITTIWIAYLTYPHDGMFMEFYFTRVGMRIWQVLVMSIVQIASIPPMLKVMSKIKFPVRTNENMI